VEGDGRKRSPHPPLTFSSPIRFAWFGEGDELRYEVRPDDGPTMVFPQSQIWHIRGPSWNGWLGLDATKLARDAIGLSIATERQHAELHGKGSKIGGLLSVEDNLSAEKFKDVGGMDRPAWERRGAGTQTVDRRQRGQVHPFRDDRS
jgi:hypothetical protein